MNIENTPPVWEDDWDGSGCYGLLYLWDMARMAWFGII